MNISEQIAAILKTDVCGYTSKTLEMLFQVIPNGIDHEEEQRLINIYAGNFVSHVTRYLCTQHLADHDCKQVPMLLDSLMSELKKAIVEEISAFQKHVAIKYPKDAFQNPFAESKVSEHNQHVVEEILKEESDV